MSKKYTEEERIAARKESLRKYNEKNKEKMRLYYLENKKELKEKQRNYYLDNADELKEKQRKYHNNNKLICNKKSKEYYKENKDSIKVQAKEYREKTKLNKRDYDKKYRLENKDKVNTTKRVYNYKKRWSDPLFRLTSNVRRNISDAIRRKNFTKNSKTYEILGCSFIEFKTHIESQWESWMNWDNYGNPKDGILEPNKTWDLDHIIPLSTAINENDVIKLNHHTNFQPLCSYVNRLIKNGGVSFSD